MTRLPVPVRAAPLLACLCAPAITPLGAQSRYTLTPFIASNLTLPGPSTLYGASIASYGGLLGYRVSGAAGVESRLDGSGGSDHRVGAFTADLDGVLSAGAIPGLSLLLGGFVPSAFVGLGVEGGRDGDSVAATVGPVISYGAGVTRAFLGNIGLESEARYRVPTSLDRAAAPAELRRGWEFRVGLTIGFGGRSQSHGGGASLPRPPAPTGPRGAGRARAPASASAAKVLSTADRYLGTRYVYGGSTPKGFDCSGFVQYVYGKQGVELPRTSRQQSGAGERVRASLGALRAGDLMLFDASPERSGVDHVAIYAGGNRMIHASSSGGGVRYDDLTTSRGAWFVERMVAARRLVADGRTLVGALDDAVRAQQLLDPPDHAPKP